MTWPPQHPAVSALCFAPSPVPVEASKDIMIYASSIMMLVIAQPSEDKASKELRLVYVRAL